jgi:gamma-glutamylcyclotransferase (GGCT)/AIG2-like uncharacterized protein YtfP
MQVWNFAFGSHLNVRQLCRIIGKEPERSMRAVLPDHRLTFHRLVEYPKEYVQLAAGGGPIVIPEKGHRVYGVAYSITVEQLDPLDEYEQAWGYQRVQLQVKTEDGGFLLAQAHNLVRHGEFAPPSSEFLNLMLEGLKEHGYPTGVIQEVKKAALDAGK